MSEKSGNPWVLLVMNLFLSGLFSYVVVWGLSVIDALAFSWRTVGTLTIALAVLTWVITR